MILGWALAAAVGRADEPPDADPAQVEFFESKVRPVLAAHCLNCHGPEKQKAGLRLDSAEAMREGGDIGPVVMPGDPDNSPLVEVVRYDSDIRMPPKGKLKEAEIDALTEWVRRGAVWPASPAAATASATSAAAATLSRDFWAFQPVRDPVPPAVRDDSWIRSPLDRFVLSQLEEAGLRPAPIADKRTLIRRVTFDLIGLPPTPEEVDAYLADESPDAFARVVDRLLASPHYGERWGRHWLDLARYGEDQAHSFKPRLYPEGWRYRDWLVQALNSDLPYDRFLTEQIAADLLDEPGRLERLPALGFFALGPVYYGDAKKLDQYDDRIDTLTRGVLGLTVACARCHDHKYDPITQRDYYGLAGIIASTEYHEAPLVPDAVVQAYDQAQQAIKDQEERINSAIQAEQTRLQKARAAEITAYLLAVWDLRDRPREESLIRATAERSGLDARRLERWVRFLQDAKSSHQAPLTAWFALADRDPPPCHDEVALAAQEIQDRVVAALDSTAVAGTAKEEAAENADKALTRALINAGGPLDTTLSKSKVEEEFSAESRASLATLRNELERLKRTAPPRYPIAHALKEGTPTTMKVLLRGNPDNPGEEAARRFLEVLGGTLCEQGSGRLDLARAITDPDNPLTARVMVNRVWHHHFGRGLVGTPSNFGQLGERPSHPELLDWLASRLVESGWSLKTLHRLILLSATYQQSSRHDPQAFEIDPENRRLWRMNRRRLEIEAWRDALLAVSGQLDPTLGGPSFDLDDGKTPRRTFYAAISRHNLSPLLRLFDFPDPNITSGDRTRTTVPLQQLVVLNDELLVRTARALVDRLSGEPDDAARVRRAYALLFARPATDEELRIGLDYLSRSDAGEAGDLTRWQRYAQALLGTNEFAYID
jgi:mono/diheme cytochrome c family protein